jgi:hypothetical protein
MPELHQRYISHTIIPTGQLSLHLGSLLLKGIKPGDFARLAPGHQGPRVQSNHPAWVYGHLACYPTRCMDLLGRPEEAAKLAVPALTELFKAGTECKDDPAGQIYPSMDTIVNAWKTGYEHVLRVLPEIPDDVLMKINPNEQARERFPTIGSAIAFLVSGHQNVHLGQVSAWRRFMGLPGVM